MPKLIFKFLNLRLGSMHHINFGKVIIFSGQLYCRFLSKSLDVLLGFVLTVVNLLYLLFQLIYKPECVSLRDLLAGAHAVCNVVLVIGYVSDTVGGSQLVALVVLWSQGFYLWSRLRLFTFIPYPRRLSSLCLSLTSLCWILVLRLNSES